jgi:hypothetical protein
MVIKNVNIVTVLKDEPGLLKKLEKQLQNLSSKGWKSLTFLSFLASLLKFPCSKACKLTVKRRSSANKLLLFHPKEAGKGKVKPVVFFY